MKLTAILLLTAVTVGCNSDSKRSSLAEDTLHEASATIGDLLRGGENPIPDTLLNRTNCAAVVNSPAAGEGLGVLTCRYSDNGWSAPAFVTFQRARAQANATQQLLVLFTTDRAIHQLMKGGVALGARPFSAPGLFSERSVTITDADLASDAFVYARVKHGLSGVLFAGSMRPDGPTTRDFYNGKLDFAAALRDRNPPRNDVHEFTQAVTSFFNAIRPVGIIIHHSATLPDNKVPANEQEVDRFHQARGFDVVCFGKIYHVAYHYLINPDGKVVAGRPEHCEGAHARGYNSYLGISVLGDFSSVDNPTGAKGLIRPTAAQMKSLEQLCRRLMREYRIPVQRVLRHSDVARTRCPGDRFPFPAFLHALEQAP